MDQKANESTLKPPRQAVLMAAGRGKRLAPLTDETPKPMIRVGGRPILEWSLQSLPPEIEEVILVIGYRGEQVREHFGNSWGGRSIRYAVQKELKGTGHVMHVVRPLLDSRFLAMNGDDLYLPNDLRRLCGHELAALGIHLDDNGRFGLLTLDEAGFVTGISRDEPQQGSGLVNIGAYVLDHRFFEYDLVPIGNGSEFGLPQTIATMTDDCRIRGVEAKAWFPVGFPQDIEPAEDWLRLHRSDDRTPEPNRT